MKKLLHILEEQKIFVLIAVVTLALAGTFAYRELYTPISSQYPSIKDFPVIPVYPNAVLVNSTTDPKEGIMYIGVKYGATWKIKQEVPEVAKWYESKLKNAGWKIETLPANPDAKDVQLLTLSNSKYNLSMSFTRDDYAKFTSITAEFSTNYTGFCESTYDGKPCTN